MFIQILILALIAVGVVAIVFAYNFFRKKIAASELEKELDNSRRVRDFYCRVTTPNRLFSREEIEDNLNMIANYGLPLRVDERDYLSYSLKVQYSILFQLFVRNESTHALTIPYIFKWDPEYLVNYNGYGSQTLGEKTQEALLNIWKIYLESLEKLSEVMVALERMKKLEEPFPKTEGFLMRIRECAENRSTEVARSLIDRQVSMCNKYTRESRFDLVYQLILDTFNEISTAILESNIRTEFYDELRTVLIHRMEALRDYLVKKVDEEALTLNGTEIEMRKLILRLSPPIEVTELVEN